MLDRDITTVEQLEELAAQFDTLAIEGHAAIVKAVADRLETMPAEQIGRQHDPYGGAWESLSARSLLAKESGGGWFGYHETLVDTGALALSFSTTSQDEIITLASELPYARIHNAGSLIGGYLAGRGILMPKRQYVPDDEHGWGEWEEPVYAAAEAALEQFFV